MSKKLLLFLSAAIVLFSIFTAPLMAQNGSKITIVLQDKANSEPVSFATVSLTKKGESKAYKYNLSNKDGVAFIEGVRSGTYMLKAEMMGYHNFEKEISVGKSNLDLGTVQMTVDTEQLDAASISAVGNPILMKKDTIEYNASSFKTTENSMLEDLLKKLPGVEVGEDGSITANGETITKITIDGKTFFLDDPQLASKNLPAKIINKVKVVQKKSEQAEFTGIDDGEEETIIDLSVKRGMMKGVIGNFAGGVGHDLKEKASGSALAADNGDLRYQGNGFMGKFGEDTHISLILNANNTNNRGFRDMSGSMMSGMRGGGGGMGGMMGGFGRGNGINTSWMAGLNGASNFFDNKMELGGNYVFNTNRNDVQEKNSKTTYLDDRNLVYNNDGYSTTNTYGNRFGFRLEHKFSENTSIFFTPQVNFGHGNYHQFSKTNTDTDYGSGRVERTNEGFNNTLGNNNNWSTSGFFLFRQKLGMPGRTLTINSRYSFSNNDLNGFNQSLTRTYQDETPRDSVINQRFDQNQRSSSFSAGLTYTEPLGGGFYVEANYRASFNRNTSWKNTFDSHDNSAFSEQNMKFVEPGTKNLTYSNEILNRYVNQNAGANFKYQKDKLRAQVGVGFIPTNTHNETNGAVYQNKKTNWAPSAMLWYDMSDFSHLRFFYHGRSAQPSTSQLMAVPDNSNPLNVSFGNPYLTPYFNHNLRGEYRYTNKKTFTSLNANINASMVQDPIVNATWYDLSGAQYSMPVNGHSSFNASYRVHFNSPIAKSNFSVFLMSHASFSQSSSYVGSSFDVSRYYQQGEFDYELFHQDYPSLDEAKEFTLNNLQTFSATENLRLTYRTDHLELAVGGRTRINKSWYTISASQTDMTFNNQLVGSFEWTTPFGLEISSDLRYNWYNGYITQQDPEFIWNAELNKLLFKDKVTIAARAYDILAQSKNLSVSDKGNQHQETLNNTLGRYIIFAVSYRFGTFGGRGGQGGPGGPGMRGPGRR